MPRTRSQKASPTNEANPANPPSQAKKRTCAASEPEHKRQRLSTPEPAPLERSPGPEQPQRSSKRTIRNQPPPLYTVEPKSEVDDDDTPPPTQTKTPNAASTTSHHSSTVASGGKGSLTGVVQSSIPGLSIAEIRAVLSEQRKLFQENRHVNLTDQVMPGMNRITFNYEYVNGIARKRFAKHQRASAKPCD